MITIHALLQAPPQWLQPGKHLPVTTDVIQIVGDILTVENNEAVMVLKKLDILPL
jgi:hypothetical protein